MARASRGMVKGPDTKAHAVGNQLHVSAVEAHADLRRLQQDRQQEPTPRTTSTSTRTTRSARPTRRTPRRAASRAASCSAWFTSSKNRRAETTQQLQTFEVITRAPPGARFFARRRRSRRRRLLQSGGTRACSTISSSASTARCATLSGHATSSRPTPGANIAEAELDAGGAPSRRGPDARQSHRRNLRAGALCRAGAHRARSGDPRSNSAQAAREEEEHLAWTRQRLAELSDRPSLLNPLWYGGAFAIGVARGRGERSVNLGFVVETERQVEDHLTGHIEQLPAADATEPRDRRADARRRGAPRRDGARGRRSGAAVSGQAADARRRGRDARGRVPDLRTGGRTDFRQARSASSRAARTAFATASTGSARLRGLALRLRARPPRHRRLSRSTAHRARIVAGA